MAIHHGQPGSFPRGKLRKKLFVSVFLFIGYWCLTGWLTGMTFGSHISWLRKEMPWLWATLSIVAIIGLIPMIWLMNRTTDRLLDAAARAAKGAVGETVVADHLRALPDTYHVFHGVRVGHADIDHVIVAPTSVFCIDTKHWANTVKAKNGDLVQGTTPRPTAKPLVGRVLKLREEIHTTGPKPFFSAILVFVDTDLQVAPGEIPNVACLHDDRLVDYLRQQSMNQRDLPSTTIESLIEELKKRLAEPT